VKIPRKPRLEAAARSDIDLYSLDQLRTFCHDAQGEVRTLIRLQNSDVTREEVESEIRWRVHREGCRFWLLAVMAFIAALSGCISVLLGWMALALQND
jgi:hypothetical protein